MNRRDPLLLVRVADSSGGTRPPRKLLREVLDLAYRERGKRPAALDLALLDDAAIRALNRRHRSRDRATDVLAFADGEEEPDGRLRLGDVAISAETARREAGARGVSFRDELVFYALHGLLHLLGMDDAAADGRKGMHAAQADAMRKCGLNAGAALLGDALAPDEGD
ncbi:MAG: rRNA maturation RNase YbeY [Planctomycetota bacterium]|jgi:rRNA maturation RNase YbeY|nr:rRNA maturation RNase YbeY [Planctomycetota bacterium]